jgi:hypothetical protein
MTISDIGRLLSFAEREIGCGAHDYKPLSAAKTGVVPCPFLRLA